jgi:hypothetical protein
MCAVRARQWGKHGNRRLVCRGKQTTSGRMSVKRPRVRLASASGPADWDDRDADGAGAGELDSLPQPARG